MFKLQIAKHLMEAIRSIPDRLVKTPNIPVDEFLQESEDLFRWLQPDKEKIIAAGVPVELIDEMPERAEALREAQAWWIKELDTRSEYQDIWNDKSPDAFDFRDTLIHTFRYAYRHHPDILGRISYIDEDYSNADMIQDLRNLSVLGRSTPKPLKAIGFDMELLDKASELSSELADILARSNGETQSDNEAKEFRDRAYTHLKEAVDEVRECGKYLFWRDEDRLRGYSSSYLRRMRRRAKTSKIPEEGDGDGEVT
jgi:hypothetical protein